MVAIGQRNTLRVVEDAAPGFYLDGGNLGNILLPGRYIPKGARPGDTLDVFIYRDSEDRLVATTETPHAMVGEFAFLKVVNADPRMGAFLDWGLSKDLLLPIREQSRRLSDGDWVVVYLFLDPKTGRIAATSRLNQQLGHTEPPYTEGQSVSLLVAEETPLGYKAIVENAHWGLLYHGELSGPLRIGQKINGYVRAVLPEGKIDLGLDEAGYQRIAPLTEQIIAALKSNGGRLGFDDQSSPEAIRETFGTSKKAFKQAIGALYRDRRIRFTEPGIELVESDSRKSSAKPPLKR